MKKNYELRSFAKYISMSAFSLIAFSFYIIVDTIFIAQGIGEKGLAALNLGLPIWSFIASVGMMISIGSSTRFSINKVKNDRNINNQIFSNAVYFILLVGSFFISLGLFCADYMIRFFGADQDVFSMALDYGQIMLFCAPLYLLNSLFLCFVRNDNNPRVAMIGIIAACLANTALDYVFIFPLHMGMKGAALATAFAPTTAILTCLTHYFSSFCQFKLIRTRLKWELLKDYCKLGFSTMINELSNGIVLIIVNLIILGLNGNLGVAAYGVILNISMVIFALLSGIAQGMQPLTSRAYGKNNWARVKRFLKYALTLAMIISIINYLIIYLLATPITDIFNSDGNQDFQQISEQGLKLYFLIGPFMGINIVLSMFFVTTDNPVPSQIISTLRGFVFIIPLAYVLSKVYYMPGVWISFPLSELLVSLIAIYLYFRSQKRRNDEVAR